MDFRRDRGYHVTMDITERFWSKVNRAGADDCWEWNAGRDWDGYGIFSLNGGKIKAHRMSWQLVHDSSVLPWVIVRHRCDNPPCCNPAHLVLGTHLDNTADKMAKGRQARGVTHGSRTKPGCAARGDRNGARTKPERLARGKQNGSWTKPERRPRGSRVGGSKLDEWMVVGIMARWLQGASWRQLGYEYGITKRQSGNIVSGRCWAHLFLPETVNEEADG